MEQPAQANHVPNERASIVGSRHVSAVPMKEQTLAELVDRMEGIRDRIYEIGGPAEAVADLLCGSEPETSGSSKGNPTDHLVGRLHDQVEQIHEALRRLDRSVTRINRAVR